MSVPGVRTVRVASGAEAKVRSPCLTGPTLGVPVGITVPVASAVETKGKNPLPNTGSAEEL